MGNSENCQGRLVELCSRRLCGVLCRGDSQRYDGDFGDSMQFSGPTLRHTAQAILNNAMSQNVFKVDIRHYRSLKSTPHSSYHGVYHAHETFE